MRRCRNPIGESYFLIFFVVCRGVCAARPRGFNRGVGWSSNAVYSEGDARDATRVAATIAGIRLVVGIALAG